MRKNQNILSMIWILALCLVCFGTGCKPKEQVKWEKYTLESMEEAMSQARPIFAYFYAAWCPPCFEMKKTTFMDPAVIERLSQYQRIKFDMSFRRSPRIQALYREYGVSGVPHAIIFFPWTPEEERMHLSGYLSTERLISALDAFESKNPLK